MNTTREALIRLREYRARRLHEVDEAIRILDAERRVPDYQRVVRGEWRYVRGYLASPKRRRAQTAFKWLQTLSPHYSPPKNKELKNLLARFFPRTPPA
jgi:hypothetical protein